MSSFNDFEKLWEESLAQSAVQLKDPLRIFVNLFGEYIAEQIDASPKVAQKIKQLTAVDPKEDLYVIDASSGTILPLHSCYVLEQSEMDASCLDSASDSQICTFALQNGTPLSHFVQP